MHRPTVLHCARDWVRPSEGFVSDLVRSTTATRAVVACERRWPGSPADDVEHRTYEVGALTGRLAWRRRRTATNALLAAVALVERAALLHAHLGYWAPHVAAVAERLHRPWAVSLHGHDLLVEAARDPALLGAIRRAPLVVVPSRSLADAAEVRGVPADALRVIPSGLDLGTLPFRERSPDPDGRMVVTFAGRFVEKKGVLDAVAALARVAPGRPGLRARFVGYGPLGDELRRAIAAAGLDAEVVDGTVPGAVRAALEATHLLLSPSRTAADGDAETLGLVNLEALAMGVPVVATDHGPFPEVLPPDGATLVGEGDMDALTGALDGLLGAPERWASMGRAGREHVARRFELGARVAELEAQHLALLRTGSPAPQPSLARPGRPRVAVVISTYDRRALLTRTLDALEVQTYPRDAFGVVVVDNGSGDGTWEALARRETSFPLTVLRNEVNTSAADARNRALRVVDADVVAFTDDDCRPIPTWLEALVAGLTPDADMVQGRTGPDPAQPLEPLSRTQWTAWEFGLYETCNMAYRSAVLERLGPDPFRTDLPEAVNAVVGPVIGKQAFGEDTDMAWRVKRTGARSRFAVHAVVHHHVFPPDVGYLLRRAALTAGFPLLVRRIPEVRERFLWWGIFLGPRRPPFLLALAGAAAALGGRRRAILLALPYAWRLLRPLERGRRARLRAAPPLVARDAVETAALSYGSVRARTPVL
jgi:glycosyltransferase involved in cell wall biosynthesis